MEMINVELVGNDFQVRIKKNLQAFQKFVSQLRHPVLSDGDYIIASVIILTYRKGSISKSVGEVMLITHGHGFGNIRIADGGKELVSEDIYHLLEDNNHVYQLDRSERSLIIEGEPLTTRAAHRIELHEYLPSLI